MKKIIISSIILILISCHKTTKKENIEKVKTHSHIEQKIGEKIKDSIRQHFLDTINIQNSPVKIISSKLLKNAYSDHKDIQIIFKNISKKDVKAIKFEWYCENAFDKPASGKSFFIKGKSTGESTTFLKKQQTRSKIWEDFSTDANTILSARAYEVTFSNGTKWKLEQSIVNN